jgi:hypothetical protein
MALLKAHPWFEGVPWAQLESLEGPLAGLGDSAAQAERLDPLLSTDCRSCSFQLKDFSYDPERD